MAVSATSGTNSPAEIVIGILNGYNNAAVTASLYLEEATIPMDCVIGGSRAYAETAGSGSGNTVLDVLKNGSTIWHTAGNKPTLLGTDTGNFDSTDPDVVAINEGDRIALQVSSIPATTGHARVFMTVCLENPAGLKFVGAGSSRSSLV